jgi:hypothetical protein
VPSSRRATDLLPCDERLGSFTDGEETEPPLESRKKIIMSSAADFVAIAAGPEPNFGGKTTP